MLSFRRQLLVLSLVLLLGISVKSLGQNGSSAGVVADAPPLPPPCDTHACVFYSGDFNPGSPAANGLIDGVFQGGGDGTVWTPFRIDDRITVKGLFIKELFALEPPLIPNATWSIASLVSQGNPGTVICSGTTTPLIMPTNRTFVFGNTVYHEYTILIELMPSEYCGLRNMQSDDEPESDAIDGRARGGCPSACYMAIEGNVTSSVKMPNHKAYLSDVQGMGINHIGLPNILNGSFFNSIFFQRNYVPADMACTVGPPLSITQDSCAMFSVGIIGMGQ